MKSKVYQIEEAQVSCFFVSGSPSEPDEYQVDIVVGNLKYSIFTTAGPFEKEICICERVYTEWMMGLHGDVIAETI